MMLYLSAFECLIQIVKEAAYSWDYNKVVKYMINKAWHILTGRNNNKKHLA